MARVYLDHNASTPLAPEVFAAMRPHLEARYGNASSLHEEGRRARDAIERARAEVAALAGARREDVVFTSGGTEANNLALLGAARRARAERAATHVVTSTVEHPSVLEAVARLREEGFEVSEIAPDPAGRVAPEALVAALRDDTAIVSLSAANHEVGTIQQIAPLAHAARARGILVHVDAVQAAGKVAGLALADLVSFSAHKLYGPQGIGALVGPGVAASLTPLLYGGLQERGRRPGSEPVAAIVGFGAACALWRREGAAREERVRVLRDRLERAILAIDGSRLFGPTDGGERVAGTICAGFERAEGQLVVAALDLEGIAASTGAACSSGKLEPSRVVRALGQPLAVARTAVRFSLGWGNDEAEIDRVADRLPPLIARVRGA